MKIISELRSASPLNFSSDCRRASSACLRSVISVNKSDVARSLVYDDTGRVDIRVKYGSIFAETGDIWKERYFASRLGLESRDYRGQVFFRMYVIHGHLLQFFSGISKHLADGRVGVLKLFCFNIRDDDSFGGVIRICLVSGFGFAQGIFGVFAFGCVGEKADKAVAFFDLRRRRLC